MGSHRGLVNREVIDLVTVWTEEEKDWEEVGQLEPPSSLSFLIPKLHPDKQLFLISPSLSLKLHPNTLKTAPSKVAVPIHFN